jgi:hypothetical protein
MREKFYTHIGGRRKNIHNFSHEFFFLIKNLNISWILKLFLFWNFNLINFDLQLHNLLFLIIKLFNFQIIFKIHKWSRRKNDDHVDLEHSTERLKKNGKLWDFHWVRDQWLVSLFLFIFFFSRKTKIMKRVQFKNSEYYWKNKH